MVFFEQAQDFIHFCRPLYSENFHLIETNQITVLIGSELYFRCNKYGEANCVALMRSLTDSFLKEADFILLYEMLDVFCDSAQE